MEVIMSYLGDILTSLLGFFPNDITAWKDLAVIFRDIAIGFSTIYAITIGAKKLKAYLDEDLKQRIKEMRSSNKHTHEFVVRAIEEIEADCTKANCTRPISEDDIDWLKEISVELSKKAINANTTTQTLVFLLKRVLIDLQPRYKSKETSEIICLSDIYRFFHAVLIEILHDTRGVFEIPQVLKSKGELKRKFEYSFGVDLKPNSYPVLKFYDLTQNSRTEYLTLSLLSTIGSNYPIFRMMLKYGVYVPPILGVKQREQDRIFKRPSLQLISVGLRKRKIPFFNIYKVVNASYSPIRTNLKYLHDRKSLDVNKSDFYDLVRDQELPDDFFNSAVVYDKQVVKLKLEHMSSHFLWGYKRLALKKWIEKKVYTDEL